MNRRNFLQVMAFAAAAFFGRLSSVMAITRTTLSPTALKQARDIGKNLVQSKKLSFVALDSFVARTNSANIMKALFEIFREAIRQTNEDKRYFLEKLKRFNDIAEAMGDYLEDMTGMGQEKDDQPCTPQTAVRNADQLEMLLNNVEYQIKRLPVIEQAKPDIQALVQSLQRDRKLITKARSVYGGIKL